MALSIAREKLLSFSIFILRFIFFYSIYSLALFSQFLMIVF